MKDYFKDCATLYGLAAKYGYRKFCEGEAQRWNKTPRELTR
jgi:hypothetical protein